jgi:hypothetical protein
MPHSSRKAAGLETPEKPVTPPQARPTMWSLAYGLGASSTEAHAFQRIYDRARRDPDAAAGRRCSATSGSCSAPASTTRT